MTHTKNDFVIITILIITQNMKITRFTNLVILFPSEQYRAFEKFSEKSDSFELRPDFRR
jgi:hypothetical protein